MMTAALKSFETAIAEARRKHFPMNLPGGITVRISDQKTVQEIFAKHSPAVFPEMHAQKQYAVPDERKDAALVVRDFFVANGHRDFLVFEKAGEVIGWFMGDQSDHSSYYLRNSGLLPEYQNQGFSKVFIPAFLAYLRDVGYERVTSQHKGHNTRVLVAMLKAGFVLTGFEVDERWGPLFKMAKLLHDDRLDYFKTRFS